jgi:hypothetical protein
MKSLKILIIYEVDYTGNFAVEIYPPAAERVRLG